MNILDTIEGALTDYATSRDAMHWIASPGLPTLTARQMAIARRLCDQTGIDGYTASVMVADWDDHGTFSPHAEDCAAALSARMQDERDGFTALIGRFFDDFGRVMSAVTEAMKPIFRDARTSRLPRRCPLPVAICMARGNWRSTDTNTTDASVRGLGGGDDRRYETSVGCDLPGLRLPDPGPIAVPVQAPTRAAHGHRTPRHGAAAAARLGLPSRRDPAGHLRHPRPVIARRAIPHPPGS